MTVRPVIPTNLAHDLPPGLPEGYRQVHEMRVTQRGLLLRLNVLALLPMVGVGFLLSGLLILYQNAGGPLVIDALPADLPNWQGTLLVLLVLPLHEWIHGQAIRHYGHTPRYGIKWAVLYATADGALFRRNDFIRIALAPLVAITLGGIALMLLVPEGVALWIGLAVTVNAGGAIGDLWMSSVALRYPAAALIEDREDCMCLYMDLRASADRPA